MSRSLPRLAAACRALASQQLRSARVMVDDFIDGPSDEQLRSVAQKLAALELGAFEYANGLTDHAVEEREVIDGNVAKTMKSMPKKSVEDARLPFEPEDMTRIFSSPLPERSGVAPRTLFWILMLAPSTGCRLDEAGQAAAGQYQDL